MSGSVKVGGTEIASHSGSVVTLDNVTLGSSAVFPTGHIIQVGSFSDFSVIAFDTDVDTICTVQLTNVLASSICIVMGYISNLNLGAASATDEGMEMYLYRDAVNLTAGMGGATDAAAFAHKSHETQLYATMSANVKDASPTTGTNNYYMKGSAFGANAPATAHEGTYGLTVFEVAQ